MDLHHFEIDCPDGVGRHTTIKLDGKQLWTVESVDIHIRADSLVEVTLKMVGDQIGLDALADVSLDLNRYRRSPAPRRQRKWYHLWLR